jgi:hypothetical protein
MKEPFLATLRTLCELLGGEKVDYHSPRWKQVLKDLVDISTELTTQETISVLQAGLLLVQVCEWKRYTPHFAEVAPHIAYRVLFGAINCIEQSGLGIPETFTCLRRQPFFDPDMLERAFADAALRDVPTPPEV